MGRNVGRKFGRELRRELGILDGVTVERIRVGFIDGLFVGFIVMGIDVGYKIQINGNLSIVVEFILL